MQRLIVLVGVCLAFLSHYRFNTDACSNIIISPGASTDGSSIIAYNADSATLYGSLYHYPAAEHAEGSMRDIYDWDSGRYLGQIPEAPKTFNVVGNMNEYGLVIGETTYGGISVLQGQSAAKIDYGSLIWVTLQRAKTAREAIQTIGNLMNNFGYASEGESFSIADGKEAWVMEIIGKGEYELGAVWVAVKVPEGHVCAHANQARIRTFPLNDPENCLYSSDVVSFAQKIGLYPTTSTAEAFSFSDVYDPVTFGGARFCDARVWSFFSSVMGEDWSSQYLDYAQGYNLTNRMPLFVRPSSSFLHQSRISASDVMTYMRSHYEGSPLDMTGSQFSDVGAVDAFSAYRAHPLTWSSKVNPDGTTVTTSSTPNSYLNERPIATQQTGWNFVAQTRSWMPRELSGLLWFGVDDAATTVRFPIYGSATAVPKAFAGKGAQDGVVPPMMNFDPKSAFYVFNLVANWAYSRWSAIYPDVLSEVLRRESAFAADVVDLDKKSLALYATLGPSAAIEFVTDYSVAAGNALVSDWMGFFGQLFVKFRDGYVITPNAAALNCGCAPVSAAYPQSWYDRIVRDTKSHYYCGPPPSMESTPPVTWHKFTSKSKEELLARR